MDSIKPNRTVLALVKGTERYVFVFDNESGAELARTMARFASNPRLSFSWNDAFILREKFRQLAMPNP